MWEEIDNQLKRNFQFKDFIQAFSFMTEVAFHAEKQGHHPNWSNVYNRVEICLNTHDAGNIVTEKDWLLAQVVDDIYLKYHRV